MLISLCLGNRRHLVGKPMTFRFILAFIFILRVSTAQNCEQSDEPEFLLNTVTGPSLHNALSAEAFNSMLPCRWATVSSDVLLKALEDGHFTRDEKKTLISLFHVASPLKSQDIVAISQSSLSGELIDEMLSPLKCGDVKLDKKRVINRATISRLRLKAVSDDTLLSLGVSNPAPHSPSISSSDSRGRIIDNPPNIAADITAIP